MTDVTVSKPGDHGIGIANTWTDASPLRECRCYWAGKSWRLRGRHDPTGQQPVQLPGQGTLSEPTASRASIRAILC